MEIPAPYHNRTVGTHRGSITREWKNRVKYRPVTKEKPREEWEGTSTNEVKVVKYAGAVPGKAAIVYDMPVPQTDTGRREENSKAGERSIVKELGKMTP